MRFLQTVTGCCIAAGLVVGCTPSPRFTSARLVPLNADSKSIYYEEGIASYYAHEYDGRRTSNGEIYDMHQMTAAHRTLPFNTRVRVTNTLTGKSAVVRINDRGPFKDDRVIDLSLAAAKELDLIGPGTAPVRLEIIELGNSQSDNRNR